MDIDGKVFRVKTTIREYADAKRNSNVYNYEVTKIELLDAPSIGDKNTSNEHLAMTPNNSIF